MPGQIIPRGPHRWLVRASLGRDERGHRRYHNHTVRGTRRDAIRYLNGVLHQQNVGTFAEPTRMSLGEYLDDWLKNSAKQRVRGRTAYEYERLLARYVRPVIGHKKVAALTPLDIQTLYAGMTERGLSARTVRYTHNVLASALKQAVKWRLTNTNPAAFVDLPRLQRKEMRALTPDEARRFLKTASGTRFEALFALALATGMRPSEYLALRWSDVDLRNGSATVRRVLTRYKSTVCFDEPKTPKSRRTVLLPDRVIELLKVHRREQRAARRFDDGPDVTLDDLVFSTSKGLPLDKHNVSHDYFKPLLEMAKISPEFRLYDLRHSCATLLLFADEHPKVVSERLGHASIVLTLDTYSHVLPTMQRQATDRLQEILFAAPKRRPRAVSASKRTVVRLHPQRSIAPASARQLGSGDRDAQQAKRSA